MAKSKHIFNEEEEKRIVTAITEAEKETSGEIRVHIEPKCKGDAFERAQEVFQKHKMHQTEHRNGVLVYVATDDKKIAVYGDKGIHDHVGQTFWDETLELMTKHFKSGNYETGLVEAIAQIGQKLKHRFPHEIGDKNELNNDISYDDTED